MRDAKLRKFKHVFDTVLIVKRLLYFTIVAISIFILYRILLNTFFNKSVVLGLVTLWGFSAYIVLPRIHRLLTKIYLPDYFIGRTRTGDGLLGDPVNLAFLGTKNDIKHAMLKAGWTQAETLNLQSTLKMIKASILKRSYPSAPVSSLYLFSKKQDFAFQQEVGGSTKSRHHIRFWKTPKNWFLPGGYSCDYLAAATFDTAVGFSLYTFQVTHKIEEDTDVERDFVIASLKTSSPQTKVHIVENFSTGYHSRNGGGDTIKTDGSLPFIKVPKKV